MNLRRLAPLALAFIALACAPFAAAQNATVYGSVPSTVVPAGNVLVGSPSGVATPQALVQSPGGQLRTNALVAAQSNPAANAPWTIVGPWTTGVGLVQGNVRSNAGHNYVTYSNSCTTGATAPTTTNGTAGSDGACGWFYTGEAQLSASDPLGPALSTYAGTFPLAAHNGGLNVLWYPAINPSVYKAYGYAPATFATNYWSFTGFKKSASLSVAYGIKICTRVYSTSFAVATTNTSGPFSVTIDGRHAAPEGMVSTTGNLAWGIYDFSATTGAQWRNVCFRSLMNNSNFAGIATDLGGVLAAPPQSQDIGAVFLYDSYDAGSASGPFTAFGPFSSQVSDRLGWFPLAMGVGGTGLQNPGSSCSTACYTYIQRIQDPTNAAYVARSKVIVFNVSTNDAGLSGEQAAVTALLNAIRVINPTALIVGVGPAPLNSGPTYAQAQALDTAGAAAFAAWRDPSGTGRACYIPMANAAIPWITDSSYMTGMPSNTNSRVVFISSADNVHPTDLGTRAMAAWVATQIATTCLPNVP